MTMKKIDTSEWKDFQVGALFEKLPLGIKNEKFNKTTDVSEFQTEEFNLPLVNAKHGNNGIMYYGRESDFDAEEMTLCIVQNGAIATGDVYAEPQRTGVLWDAYLVKLKENISSVNVLLFLACVLEKSIKDKFSYDDKCVWDKAKLLNVRLPVTPDGKPDWVFVEKFMCITIKAAKASLRRLRLASRGKNHVKTNEWHKFTVGELFPEIVKPPVIHSKEVTEDANGIPYVVRTKFNNGVKCRVRREDFMQPSPAGTISFGAENATFFYQEEEYVSGRDIYYIDTRHILPLACQFLTVCLQKVAQKYSYNYGMFPELVKQDAVLLPVNDAGMPDWEYMAGEMGKIHEETASRFVLLNNLSA